MMVATYPSSFARSMGLISIAVTTTIGMRSRIGASLERLDDVEAADVGHHQIEHDQIGELPFRGGDRLAAAVGAQERAGHALHADSDELNRLGIVVHHEDLQCLTLRHRKQPELDERLVQLLPRQMASA